MISCSWQLEQESPPESSQTENLSTASIAPPERLATSTFLALPAYPHCLARRVRLKAQSEEMVFGSNGCRCVRQMRDQKLLALVRSLRAQVPEIFLLKGFLIDRRSCW